MKVGMLWLIGDRTETLEAGLTRAADYYAAKYGRPATLCVVHPEMVGEAAPTRVGEMSVQVRTDIVRDHVWIGVGDPARG